MHFIKPNQNSVVRTSVIEGWPLYGVIGHPKTPQFRNVTVSLLSRASLKFWDGPMSITVNMILLLKKIAAQLCELP